MRSSVEIFNIDTRETRVVFQTELLIEAPNWTPDGAALLVNGDGGLYRLALDGLPQLQQIDLGFATQINNDHGISPDGIQIVISDKVEHGKSCIYVLPSAGGVPRQVTALTPSYWHGWSPNGQTLAYCGIRNDLFDIYTIPVDGGEETRLTHGEGRNDGPDYSPCGTWIYFNSSRTGLMQIWRMRTDGSELERLTHDDLGDWFPHPSPRGDKVLLISYAPDVFDHPRDRDVLMRLMNPDGSDLETLFPLFGGQGSINVPNWSPDGSSFAYVRYFPV
ncbi:TolB family protein [Rhizobium sp. RU36D]|uniref:TolB family protein n=1 Tax=Rhizobium sp. RU36D TaxID=1907415 RepID=UPI0009D868EC|nr:TolB family protein [Rhizobium sp. RU36D]SMC80834.1 WD40-like Beta Propeller Repeat [Rhizobium sp. RU36D]